MKTIVDIHKELIGHEKLAEKLDEVKSYLFSIGLEIEPFQLRAQYAITSGHLKWEIAESSFTVHYNIVVGSLKGAIRPNTESVVRYWKSGKIEESGLEARNVLDKPEASSFCHPIQAFIIHLQEKGFELYTIRDVGNGKEHGMLYGYLIMEKDGLSIEVNIKEMK